MTKKIRRVWFWAHPRVGYTEVLKVTEYSDYTTDYSVVDTAKSYENAYHIAKNLNDQG